MKGKDKLCQLVASVVGWILFLDHEFSVFQNSHKIILKNIDWNLKQK